MSIIIRLQNLPWSANSVDIRRFFSGLSIPEGGVHIVGGEMGDVFIAFSTHEDARLAMAKDGGKIKDMQIKLLLSSRTEMMRVIEQARQQNMVVTQPQSLPQPARNPTPTEESDRRRGRSPTPHRHSRDRSPLRDRRRSPDERHGSKRDHSRSPRSNRSSNRDMDRRSDHFKRDEKRYDDSHYRDERRGTRDSSQEPKKYLDADHVNSRSQLHDTEGFRNMQAMYEQMSNISMPGLYPFGNQQPPTVAKSFPEAYTHPNSSAQLSQTEQITSNKLTDFPLMDQKHSSSAAYPQGQVPFHGPPFVTPVPSTKDNSVPAVEKQIEKPRRRTRFEPETESSAASQFLSTNTKTINQCETPYRPPSDAYTEARNAWPHEMTKKSENSSWNDKRQGLLSHPMVKNVDFLQAVPNVPMDLDQSQSAMVPEKEIYREDMPPRGPPSYIRNNAPPRNDELRTDSQNRRQQQMHSDNKCPPMHLNDTQGRVPPSLTVEVRGLPPDARIDHILDIFRGIPLPAANIRIEANDQGFEKALIRFVSLADFEEALSRNRRLMHEGRCELVPCPASAFDSQKFKPKPKPREDDLTIQLRGLPFSCKDDDVVRFFDGLGILDLFIDIAADGRASGSGFVEFATHEDFRAALSMNGKMIGHRYITVSVASKEMMAFAHGEDYNPAIQHADPHRNPQYPANSRPPYSPAIQNRLPPNQIRPSINLGRPLVNQGRQPLSSNQVRPPPSSNQVRPPPSSNQVRPPPSSNQMRPLPSGNQMRPLPSGNQIRPPPSGNQIRPPPSGNQIRPPPSGNQSRLQPPPNNQSGPPACIALNNLPEGVSNKNIAGFVGEIGIVPHAVHIMLRPDKTPSGDAFVEFACPLDMERALELNGKMMKGNRVIIQPISFHEMMNILGRPNPMLPPPPASNALLRTPCDVQRPRRPLLPQSHLETGFRERPRIEAPNRGNRPFMGSFPGHMESGRPYGSGRMRAPYPKGRTFNGGNRPEGRFPPPLPELVVKDFGSPGCVVSINNLHFRAGLEELLDFFQDYQITKDNIMRKYNENGQTTGEARVAFQTPRDAQRVVRELNQKSIMGRPLSLSIL